MALPTLYKRFILGGSRGCLKETAGLQSNIKQGSTRGLSNKPSGEKTKQNAQVFIYRKTNSGFRFEPQINRHKGSLSNCRPWFAIQLLLKWATLCNGYQDEEQQAFLNLTVFNNSPLKWWEAQRAKVNVWNTRSWEAKIRSKCTFRGTLF